VSGSKTADSLGRGCFGRKKRLESCVGVQCEELLGRFLSTQGRSRGRRLYQSEGRLARQCNMVGAASTVQGGVHKKGGSVRGAALRELQKTNNE